MSITPAPQHKPHSCACAVRALFTPVESGEQAGPDGLFTFHAEWHHSSAIDAISAFNILSVRISRLIQDRKRASP
jgi:hypothetical protein